jgi:hypothetical protein
VKLFLITQSSLARHARIVIFAAVGAVAILAQGCGYAGTPSDENPPGGNPPASPPQITVSISPTSATVPAGGAQEFTAIVAGSGSQSAGVTWSVDGLAGGSATTGTIAATSSTTALYTAPPNVSTSSAVTVTATSIADATKSASATVTISCSLSSALSPSSANVPLGQTQTFTAAFCLASGASISWDVNGIVGGNSSVGTIAPTSATTALYTAPTDAPANNTVTIHATASAVSDAPATVSATVTITSHISVLVAPSSATLSPGQRQSFAVTVSNSADTTVTWFVNGVPDGNAIVGQVCLTGSNPCIAPSGPKSGAIDYLAPQTAPTPNPVMLAAASNADPTKSGSASITIFVAQGPVSVTISPAYAFLAPSGAKLSTLQFAATVANSPNTAVTWVVQSGVSGHGCAGAACGSVDASGLYTAPSTAPSPNAISVVATSAADSTKSATATVAVTSGPSIESLLPSSVMAGAAESFPLEVNGVDFAAGSSTGASVILLNGVPRATTCATPTTCTTVLNPADVQTAATLTVQVQNPGNPPPLSNPVPFVIAPFDVTAGAISLTSSQPGSDGNEIVVTEPTTAAESSPINVDFVGYLLGPNSCEIQGSPLQVTRPSLGSTVVSICVHGTGLDPTFTYQFSGPGGAPAGDDISVTPSAVSGLLPNMIELDLQISSTTAPGVRTLWITTLNNDRAVATAVLEVN